MGHSQLALFLVTLVGATVLMSPTYAETGTPNIVSANDLNEACAKDTSSQVCSAYIGGFAREFYYASISSQAGYAPCLPGNITDGDARRIVTSFIASRPEMIQQRAGSVIAEAMVTAFPCTPKR